MQPIWLLMHVHVTRTLLLLVVAFWHQSGTAAVITDRGSTVSPNNDNYRGRGNPNVQELVTVWLGAEGRAENAFGIEDSDGTTEYAVTVSVTNASGLAWTGYRFSLGLGGERGALPVASRAGDGFGFDVASGVDDPPPESDGSLSLQRWAEDVLDFSGPFADKTSVQFSFSFDVPDRLAVHRVWLFEQPMPVPEPSGFALLAAGLGALGLWRYVRARYLPGQTSAAGGWIGAIGEASYARSKDKH